LPDTETLAPNLMAPTTARSGFRRDYRRGNRAVGGRLFLTNQRLVFAPQWVERLTGQKGEWSCPLGTVERIAAAPRSLALPFSGGARRRLSVHLKDGTDELFVVNHVEAVAAALTQALRT
jgi:hypothetical protein